MMLQNFMVSHPDLVLGIIIGLELANIVILVKWYRQILEIARLKEYILYLTYSFKDGIKATGMKPLYSTRMLIVFKEKDCEPY